MGGDGGQPVAGRSVTSLDTTERSTICRNPWSMRCSNPATSPFNPAMSALSRDSIAVIADSVIDA